jgi:hypothetical protein
MQNLQDIQEKIFFESKNILDTLSKINSKDELLAKQDLFAELGDRIAFLRILEKNKESFYSQAEAVDNQYFNENYIQNRNDDHSDESFVNEDIIEEEVIFTNEINDIDNENHSEDYKGVIENTNLVTENMTTNHIIEDLEEDSSDLEDFVVNNSFVEEKEIPLVVEQEDPNYAERISQKEKDFLDSEERRRKIVEFSKAEVPHTKSSEAIHDHKFAENVTEKKFKLANIKGLKAVQSLFDDDPLEKIEEANPNNSANDFQTGSLLKSNIPTDFMEAPKKQHEFKLDLNDNLAFKKLLFNDDEVELKTTIDKLNSFQNIDDAKQYLSEVYYQKDWQKADEYAQRLWELVESKFL